MEVSIEYLLGIARLVELVFHYPETCGLLRIAAVIFSWTPQHHLRQYMNDQTDSPGFETR